MSLSVARRLELTAALLDILSKKLDPDGRVKPARAPALRAVKNPAARLHFGAELLKYGFNPAQPRDERGRWTREGASGLTRPPPGLVMTRFSLPAEHDGYARSAADTTKHIDMREITDERKKPVLFVDDDRNDIVDEQHNPIWRPREPDPHMFVQRGLAVRAMIDRDNFRRAYQQLRDDLSQFQQGGPWDAQRVDGAFVKQYRDYATIAIGIYAAAAGVPCRTILFLQNLYALSHSDFDWEQEVRSSEYKFLPERNVKNTELGYGLYTQKRIRPSWPYPPIFWKTSNGRQ
jgi:hypothetical protein